MRCRAFIGQYEGDIGISRDRDILRLEVDVMRNNRHRFCRSGRGSSFGRCGFVGCDRCRFACRGRGALGGCLWRAGSSRSGATSALLDLDDTNHAGFLVAGHVAIEGVLACGQVEDDILCFARSHVNADVLVRDGKVVRCRAFVRQNELDVRVGRDSDFLRLEEDVVHHDGHFLGDLTGWRAWCASPTGAGGASGARRLGGGIAHHGNARHVLMGHGVFACVAAGREQQHGNCRYRAERASATSRTLYQLSPPHLKSAASRQTARREVASRHAMRCASRYATAALVGIPESNTGVYPFTHCDEVKFPTLWGGPGYGCLV